MIINSSTLNGLLNNINHEKTKYITMLYKLRKLLELNETGGYILIKNQLEKLMLTEDFQVIYENVKFGHPVIKIFYEFLSKADRCVNGTNFFIKTVRDLLDNIIALLDKGIKAKEVSNSLRDIEYSFDDIEGDKVTLGDLINSVLKQKTLTSLLNLAIEETKSFDTEKIRVIKVNSGIFGDSEIVQGMVIPNSPSGDIRALKNTSVGIYNCSLDVERTELKGTVLMKNAEDLMNYSTDEMERLKKVADDLMYNVVFVNGNVNSIVQDFCNRKNIMVIKVFNKFDILRISRALNAPIFTKLSGNPKSKAMAKEISAFTKGNKKFTKIVGTGEMRTIMLKHPLMEMLDEYEGKMFKLLENLKEKTPETITINSKTIDITSTDVVAMAVRKTVDNTVIMVDEDRKRCFRYSLEFVATVLEVNDYLLAQQDQLQLGKPPMNFDEDH